MKLFKIPNPLPALILFLFFILAAALLIDEPSVWPDEALYSDIAKNVYQENRLGTDLLKGLIREVDTHAYWLPPFFMYILAGWINIFDFSIVSIRMMSVLLGLLSLTVFYFLAKNLSPKPHFNLIPLLGLFLVAIDSAFLKASRLSRPEILVIFFVLLSTFLYLKFLSNKKISLLLISGLFLGLSITTHLIAVCFLFAFSTHLIYLTFRKNLNLKHLAIFSLSALAPVLIWLISIFPRYDLLFDQLNIISQSRSYTIPWYINVLNFPTLSKLNFLIYISTSIIFIFFSVFTKSPLKKDYLLLSSILVFSWLFIHLGEIFWYTAYPLAFVYLGLVIMAGTVFKSPLKNLTACLLITVSFLALTFSNLSEFNQLFNKYKYQTPYQTFSNQINENIPPQKTVFLTSIPDAYFAFEKNRNTLYEYPAFYADLEDLKKVLSQTDYVVFSNFFSPDPISNYLDSYLTKNTERIKELESPYQVMIVKLKPQNQRTE